MVRSAALMAVLAAVAPSGAGAGLSTEFRSLHSEGALGPELAGRPFRIVLPLMRSEAAARATRNHVTYRVSQGELTLNFSHDPASSYIGYPELISLQTRYANAGSFVGRSGLGVKVRVSKRQDQTDAIALVSAPETDVIPASKYLPASHRSSFSASIPLPAAQAAAMGANTDAVIEGVIAKLSNGSTGACEDRFFEGDMSQPTDVRDQRCWIGADVKSVSFRQRTDGRVIKEWVRE